MNPVRASLRYPQVTIALTIMLVVTGAYALLRMPRREDPKIHVRDRDCGCILSRRLRRRRLRTRSRKKWSSASSKSRECGARRPTRQA